MKINWDNFAGFYGYFPVGGDRKAGKGPEPGTEVIKVELVASPINPDMNHVLIADGETGEFYGLRLLASLV